MMPNTATVVHSRAVGDALELACLSDNIARYALVTGRRNVLVTAKTIKRLSQQMATELDGQTNEAA